MPDLRRGTVVAIPKSASDQPQKHGHYERCLKTTGAPMACDPLKPSTKMKAHHVLIVDDNETLGATYEQLLSEHGFRAITARTGEEAVGRCEAGQCDVGLAIVDLRLPGIDGPTTIEALHRWRPELKIIAVSGQTLGPFFSRLADEGVRHFLAKPFTIGTLLQIIREVIQPSGDVPAASVA
jgi:DNA-binding NtrC family response regulator